MSNAQKIAVAVTLLVVAVFLVIWACSYYSGHDGYRIYDVLHKGSYAPEAHKLAVTVEIAKVVATVAGILAAGGAVVLLLGLKRTPKT